VIFYLEKFREIPESVFPTSGLFLEGFSGFLVSAAGSAGGASAAYSSY
jgi:hypothetical protein